MRTHPWLLAGGFIGLLVAVFTVSQWSRWGVVALVAAGILGWLVSFRCTHRHATLLPPVRGGGPDRDHARWYCDRCGKTWDSGLEPSTRPRVIYDGYDENKAVRAAARADSLDKQRRRLATKRGGSNRPRPARPAPVSRPGPRPGQAVLEQRAVRYADREPARPFATARRS
jgi:hypothetical protein